MLIRTLKICSALAIVGLSSTAFAQTTGAQVVPLRDQCPVKTETTNVYQVKAWLDGLVAGNAATLIPQLWSEDSIVVVPTALPYGGNYTRDQQGQYGYAVNTVWDTIRLPAPDIYARCDKVFAVTRWDATVRQTGIAVNQPLVEVFELKDSKIIRDTLLFSDTQELVNAINGITK